MRSDKPAGRRFGWPAPEALTRVGVPRGRLVLDGLLLAAISGGIVVSAHRPGAFPGWNGVVPPLGLVLAVVLIGFRLLAQERAARDAEATSAALAERAGIRQALSALRGDMVPVEDCLREPAREDRAEVQGAGARGHLPAEASQAVRRVAQEALTNVRKHAPGARTRLLLTCGTAEVASEVRDSGAPGALDVPGAAGTDGAPGRAAAAELGASGSGYGPLGMRERAGLLGGTLDAAPRMCWTGGPDSLPPGNGAFWNSSWTARERTRAVP
ncbi:hypothetical protein ABZ958_25120 [Streptomyces sp. NPDC046237]|uniref:sensor histidine kinase n=1 Tax=Streptomyces sp. NPDC046237 TaxID=3154914 RepID=UPI0033EFC635